MKMRVEAREGPSVPAGLIGTTLLHAAAVALVVVTPHPEAKAGPPSYAVELIAAPEPQPTLKKAAPEAVPTAPEDKPAPLKPQPAKLPPKPVPKPAAAAGKEGSAHQDQGAGEAAPRRDAEHRDGHRDGEDARSRLSVSGVPPEHRLGGLPSLGPALRRGESSGGGRVPHPAGRLGARDQVHSLVGQLRLRSRRAGSHRGGGKRPRVRPAARRLSGGRAAGLVLLYAQTSMRRLLSTGCRACAALTSSPGTAAAQDTTRVPEGVRVGINYTPGAQPGLVVIPGAGHRLGPRDRGPRPRLQRPVQDHSGRRSRSADRPPDPINYGLYKALGADFAVELLDEGGKVTARLHDVARSVLANQQTATLPPPTRRELPSRGARAVRRDRPLGHRHAGDRRDPDSLRAERPDLADGRRWVRGARAHARRPDVAFARVVAGRAAHGVHQAGRGPRRRVPSNARYRRGRRSCRAPRAGSTSRRCSRRTASTSCTRGRTKRAPTSTSRRSAIARRSA